jgi:hypothetical protein
MTLWELRMEPAHMRSKEARAMISAARMKPIVLENRWLNPHARPIKEKLEKELSKMP